MRTLMRNDDIMPHTGYKMKVIICNFYLRTYTLIILNTAETFNPFNNLQITHTRTHTHFITELYPSSILFTFPFIP